MKQSRGEEMRHLSVEEKVWIAIFIASLFLLFCGWCDGQANAGEIEARYAFPYSYYGKGQSYHPSIPWRRQYLTEMYRNRTFWQGFGDPVPHTGTSRCIDTWNYRIIRQYERQRLRQENGGGMKLYRNYFRQSR